MGLNPKKHIQILDLCLNLRPPFKPNSMMGLRFTIAAFEKGPTVPHA